MKHLSKILLAVVALFAYSCVTDTTEDLSVNLGNEGHTSLTISLEGTKTHIGEKSSENYPLYWSEGDKIAINGVASEALTAEADGNVTAVFEFKSALTYPYNIVYPTPVTKLDVDLGGVRAGSSQKVTFLAEQPYKAGSFAEGAAPLYAQVIEAGEAINMHHLAGVLRLAPKGEGVTLTSMTVTAEKGKIAGDFTVDCSNGTLVAETDATNVVTVTFSEGLALGAEATPIYVGLPAGEYGEIEVVLNTATDKMIVKFNSDGEKAIKAGIVREFAEFVYKATADAADEFLITTKEDLIRFASAAASTQSAKLAGVIDMTGEAWTPIQGFVGTFDGDKEGGFYIKGLSAPLFGTVSGEIKNLKLTDVDITVTENHYYTVQTDDGDVQKPVVYSGAIAYHLASGKLTGCYASGKVEVNNAVFNAADADLVGNYLDVCLGGMIGLVESGVVSSCENHIDLTLTSAWKNDHASGFSVKTGAMIGMVADSSEISSCQNYGDIVCELAHTKSKAVHMGALLGGTNADNALVVFKDCTNHGNFSVSAKASRRNTYYVGGVAGYLNKGITEFKNLTNLGCGELLGAGNGQEYRVGGIAGAINSESDNLVNGSKDDASKGCVRICSDEAGKNGNVYLAGMAYGAIAGLSNAKNYGKLTIEGYAANTYLAGILGTNASASFTNCENHGTLVHNLTATAVTNIGGILAQAYVAADNTRDIPFSITGCKNMGNIVYNVAEGAAHTGLRVIGGIYGYGNIKSKLIPVNIVNCTSGGIITVKDASGNDLELALGAVHAYTQYGATVTISNTRATTKMYVGYDVDLKTGEATPIEGHTLAGKMKAAGFHAMFSAATVCTDCDFAGEINIHGKFTKNDQIQIGGYGGYGTSMWTLTNCKFSGKIHLTDQTSFESTASKYAVISGFLGYPANDNEANVQVFKNCSLTKGASIISGAQHTNGDLYIGGYVAYTAKKTPMQFLGCHNHATMATTSSASATEDLCLGSYIGWKGGGVATFKGCYNDGDITAEGKSFKNIYVSGVIAGSSVSTIVKDSENPYCYNAGNITVGNKSGEKTIATTKTAVGGYAAYYTGGAITSDIANTGTITVSNLKSPSLYVGGIIAYLNKAGVVDSAAQFTNTGDILVSNIDVAANQVFIGGVIGDTLSAINGAQSHCGILAPEGTNASWVLGSARNSESKILATNCSVGGNTYTWDDDEENWRPKALISNNVHNYLYGSGSTTNWSGTDNYDGVTFITTKPTVTLAPAVE